MFRLERPNTSEFLINAWQKSNGNILLFYHQPRFSPERENLIELDLAGNQVSQYYYFNSSLYSPNFIYNAMFYKDVFYHKMDERLISINENNQLNIDSISNNNLSIGGLNLDNHYYINGTTPRIYSFDDSTKTFNQFFIDTASLNYSTNFFLSSISSIYKENIYLAYSNNTVTSGLLTIYSVGLAGNLNWKKTLNIEDYNLEAGGPEQIVQAIQATKDKGCIITLSIRNSNNFNDIYHLKLDSLGNFAQTFTNITNRKNTLSGLSVYPNPVKDKLNVELTEKGNYLLTITDALGKIVLKDNFENNKSIDLSALSPQVYFYSISDTKTQASSVGKFVKE